MQQIEISKLKEHPRNTYFFDDMAGDAWEAFLESIRTSGVIEPIVVTQDLVIVSGHQRVRGCKALEITKILADMRHYESEDSILKDLIETNIRQRGVGNPNPVKLGRCIKELERIYGIRDGSANEKGNNRIGEPNNSADQITQSDIADMIGISVDTLQNYKKLTELIPELDDLVQTGMATPTTARAIMRQLSEEEQLQLISSIPAGEKLTKRKADQYIQQLNSAKAEADRLRNENNRLRNQPKEVETVEVVPEDYEDLKRNLNTSKRLHSLTEREREDFLANWQEEKRKNEELQKIIEEMKKSSSDKADANSDFQKKLENGTILFCAGVANFIEKYGGYVWLADHLNELPEKNRKGYISAVDEILAWALQMKNNLNEGGYVNE